QRLVGGSAAPAELDAARTQAAQAALAAREREAELDALRHAVTAEVAAEAEAKVRLAEAAVAEAEQRLADTAVPAPFDGTVLKLLKREGEGVSTLTPEPVALFGDLSRLRVRAEVDERSAAAVAVGQPAEVSGRNLGGRSFAGRVVEVGRVMGGKTAFTRAASERKDLDVIEVVI